MREAVAAVVVAVIAAATVLTGSLGGEALARVERSVQLQWRPVYDLIVVPQGTDMVRQVGGERVLQANFMASLPNEISMEQWRTIRDLPGVNVAAPIANLGYFSRSQNFYTIQGLTPGVYTVNRKVWWDSGLGERLAWKTSANPRPARAGDCLESPPVVVMDRGGNVAEELTREQLASGYAMELPKWMEHPAEWQCFGLDPGGVFTVFGIDPTEEDRLVGLDSAMTGGHGLRGKVGLQVVDSIGRESGAYDVHEMPMLFSEQEWVTSRVRMRFNRWQAGSYQLGDLFRRASAETRTCVRRVVRTLDFILDDLTAKCIDRELQGRLAALPRRTELSVELPDPAGRILSVGRYREGRWTHQGTETTEVGRYLVASASSQEYEPVAKAPAGDWLGAVRAVPTGSYGPEPTYRQQLPPPTKRVLRYNPVGGFDSAEVAQRFSAQSQWLPEGTYQVPQAVARLDADGNPVAEPARLRPTGNALGYLVQPPQALTTLKAARQLVGKTPISAIRVRLSGVDDAGEDSWQRIEDIVRRIKDTTGLEVLVMAGSSPAKVLVQLPGISAADQPSGVQAWHLKKTPTLLLKSAPPALARTVEGFGWVEEPWLVEGASVRYLQASVTSHLWLLGVVGVAGLVYLAAAFTSLGLARIPLVAIRRAVGWSRTRVFARELVRAALLGLVGALVGVAGGLLAARLGGLQLDTRLVAIAAPAAVVVCCLAALWPAWRVSGVPLAAALSGSEVAVTTGTGRRRSTKVQRVPTMAVVELWRLRTRALLALVSGTVAVGAIVTLTSVREQFAGSLQVTLLGQELLVVTGPLQRAATGVAVVLAVLMLAELLWQAVRDRRREIGMLRAIGWGRGHVVRLMVWQGVLLGVMAAVLGALATTGALAATIADTTGALGLLADTIGWAAAAGVVLGATAAGLPAWAAARIPPADSLRTV